MPIGHIGRLDLAKRRLKSGRIIEFPDGMDHTILGRKLVERFRIPGFMNQRIDLIVIAVG